MYMLALNDEVQLVFISDSQQEPYMRILVLGRNACYWIYDVSYRSTNTDDELTGVRMGA